MTGLPVVIQRSTNAMKIINKRRSEKDLETIAARAYEPTTPPADPAPAIAALARQNPRIAPDLEALAVGTPLLVPEVPGRKTGLDARDPTRLAADGALALRRVLPEVEDDVARGLEEERERAADIIRRIDEGTLPFTNAEYRRRIRDREESRLKNVDSSREVVQARTGLLRVELDRLLRLLGAEPQRSLRVRRFTMTSPAPDVAAPEVTLTVPAGYKILGGGAQAALTGNGILLTASYPESVTTWVARAKAHVDPAVGALTVTVVALHDPDDAYDVRVFEATSAEAPHPVASARVDAGYTMTGGGAQARFTGTGSLLTASHPADRSTWTVASKDHITRDPAVVTAYAIGVRSRRSDAIETVFGSTTSPVAAVPATEIELPAGIQVVGGGARVNWRGPGNLLVSSIPGDGNTWRASGKEHAASDPASITVFAIGLPNATLEP